MSSVQPKYTCRANFQIYGIIKECVCFIELVSIKYMLLKICPVIYKIYIPSKGYSRVRLGLMLMKLTCLLLLFSLIFTWSLCLLHWLRWIEKRSISGSTSCPVLKRGKNALLELSKKRESVPDLAPMLWHSFGELLQHFYRWVYILLSCISF